MNSQLSALNCSLSEHQFCSLTFHHLIFFFKEPLFLLRASKKVHKAERMSSSRQKMGAKNEQQREKKEKEKVRVAWFWWLFARTHNKWTATTTKQKAHTHWLTHIRHTKAQSSLTRTHTTAAFNSIQSRWTWNWWQVKKRTKRSSSSSSH